MSVPLLPLALPSGANQGRQPHAGIATIINGYAEPAADDQRSQMQIWAAPGLDGVVTFPGTGGVRGLIEVDGIAYVVSGRSLHRVDAGGSYTTIGGVPSDGYVGMARNQRGTGVQTIIACDGLTWAVVGGTQTRITDGDLPPAIDVCVVNRSAIFATPDGRMFRSEIDDATVIDGLDVAVAEAAPDGLMRVVDRGGDLIALGASSMEVWTDTGGELFGFSRQYVVRIGCVGARSVTKATVLTAQTVTDTVAWVATDRDGRYAGIVMLDGYTPRKISTLYVDGMIEDVADKGAIIASAWVSRGHGHISFRLPTTTLVYDTTTSRWHERQSRTSRGAATTWRVGYTTVLGGRVLAGDADNPKLYWLDEDTADEDGDEMVLRVRTPPVTAFPGKIEMNHLYLDVVPGVGTGQGSAQDIEPEIAMRFSRDNETWSAVRTRQLGRQGERARRVSWTSLGTFDQATLEFSCSAAVVRGIMSATWDGRTIKP